MRKKFMIVVASLALALLALPAVAFADGAPELQESLPADGAAYKTEDLIGADLYLHFSNNVAESTVSSDNTAKVHIDFVGEGSYEIAYGVWTVDPNEDRDKRQYLYITIDSITPGQYQLVIDPGITAKNGSSAEQGWVVNFTVEGEQAPAGGSGAGGFPTWAWIAIAAVVVIAVVAIVALKKKPKTE